MATLTVNPTVNGNAFGSSAAWPPAAATSAAATNYILGRGYNGSVYYIYNWLCRFDTSAIPDGSTITAAKLRVYAKSGTGANRSVAGGYYDPGASVDTGDWSSTIGTDAFAGTALTDNQYNEITLLSPQANINQSGFTGFRIQSIDVGTPSADDLVQVDQAVDAHPPELVVVYDPPATQTNATMNVPVTLTMGVLANRNRVRAMNLSVTLSMNGSIAIGTPGAGAMSAMSAMSAIQT